MTGFLFFDGERRLCMTVAEETIRPGDGVKAVVWMADTRRWGPPTTAVYVRPARWALLSDEQRAAVETPAVSSLGRSSVEEIWPLCWPSARA
jgi:hypothetical protein